MKKLLLLVPILALVMAACTPAQNAPETSDDTMMMEDGSESMNDSDMMMDDTSMQDSEGVMVGGAMMVPTETIYDNAMESNVHTTLVAAVQAAGLEETLRSPGPYTVFAPTNSAFEALPAGTVETLVKPENMEQLKGILTYHVVSGSYTAAKLSDGQTLTTVQGETLTVVMENNQVFVEDTQGNRATVTTADVISSNGVTHVIDAVLMPSN